eukprot:c9281_g1_i2.p1 GENE.c9281_g1_i2~~c9281_g1_i2.p1  ORF type:complete len:259 (+),score=70.02 c9281_g1_i2:576-1352(+)
MLMLEKFVLSQIREIDPQILASACGSFRRGSSDSGDIDFLVTHPRLTSETYKNLNPNSTLTTPQPAQQPTIQSFFAKASKRQAQPTNTKNKALKSESSSTPGPAAKIEPDTDDDDNNDNSSEKFDVSSLLQVVVQRLKQAEFLTDDLVNGQSKYMGVCLLPDAGWEGQVPEKPLHRRIDIRVFPYETYYTALLYFTGSDQLNKQMRIKAIEMGMHLSEYAICPMGETGVKGDPLPVTCEKDVFDYLDMPYLEPHQRSL